MTSSVRRRRPVTAAAWPAGVALLGRSLRTEPGSPQFYRRTVGVAATWTGAGLAAGPVRLGWSRRQGPPHRPVITPVLIGVGAFGAFYGTALLARQLPVLNKAISQVLRYAHQGSGPLLLLTTLANGVGEEIFFRGALYDAVGGKHPVALSTALYALATAATGNPALVLASAVMGTVFGLQRRATAGVLAPTLTHLTWSALMLRFVTPLFPADEPGRDA